MYNIAYSADLLKYNIRREQMPLYTERVAAGIHPELYFHDHKFSEIVVVLSGEAEHIVGNHVVTIGAGDVLLLHPKISHGYDKTATMEIINIVYDYRKLSIPLLDGYALPLFHSFFPSNESFSEEQMCRPLLHLAEDKRDEIYRKIMRLDSELKESQPGKYFVALALFMEIVALLARHGTVKPVPGHSEFQIGEVISYMNRHLEHPINIEDLTRHANMSRTNLFRKFTATVGCSPQSYLQELRIKKAAELLLGTNLPVEEIAVRSGFCDSNYLCRVFRQKLNTTPQKFRKSNS